jgi:hypothetical protein
MAIQMTSVKRLDNFVVFKKLAERWGRSVQARMDEYGI